MDSLNDRLWVDQEMAKDFILCLQTAFDDKETYFTRKSIENMQSYLLNELKTNTKLQLKNLLKTVPQALALPEIRFYCASSIESWLNHPTFTKSVWDVVNILVMTLKDASELNMKIIQILLEMKVKPTHLASLAEAMVLLAKNDPFFPHYILRFYVMNEFHRTPNNNKMLQLIFKDLDNKESSLAVIFHEVSFLPQYQQVMKNYIRRIVKTLYGDLNLELLMSFVFSKREEMVGQDLEKTSLWIYSLIDCATSIVAQYAISTPKRDENLRNILSNCISLAVHWLAHVVPFYVHFDHQQTLGCLYTLCMINSTSTYLPQNLENLVDSERGLFPYWFAAVPVSQPLLVDVSTMILSEHVAKDFGFDLINKLLFRACATKRFLPELNPISCTDSNILLLLLQISFFNSPIPLAHPYQIHFREHLWQSLVICVILTAFNTSTIGKIAWQIPTLRNIIKILIKKRFEFVETSEDVSEVETFCQELSRHSGEPNFEFFHQSNFANWHLTFIAFHHEIDIINPPKNILIQLKKMEEDLQLGALMTSSRDPDFLFHMIQEEGAQNSIVWLTNIMQSGNLTNVLPVNMIVDLLVMTLRNRDQKQLSENLIEKVKSFVVGSSGEQVLKILFEKMISKQIEVRKYARIALSYILPDGSPSWLYGLTGLSYWSEIKTPIGQIFYTFCQIDNNVDFITQFTEFVYSTNLKSSAEIATLFCNILKNRKRLFENSSLHLLMQNVMYQTLLFFKSNPSKSTDSKTLVYFDQNQEIHLVLPSVLIQGLLDFICLPVQFTFSKSFHEMIHLIVSSQSVVLEGTKKTPLLNKTHYESFVFTHLNELVDLALKNMNVEQLVGLLGKFGVSSYCLEKCQEMLASQKDLLTKHVKSMKMSDKDKLKLFVQQNDKIKSLLANLLEIVDDMEVETSEIHPTIAPKWKTIPIDQYVKILSSNTKESTDLLQDLLLTDYSDDLQGFLINLMKKITNPSLAFICVMFCFCRENKILENTFRTLLKSSTLPHTLISSSFVQKRFETDFEKFLKLNSINNVPQFTHKIPENITFDDIQKQPIVLQESMWNFLMTKHSLVEFIQKYLSKVSPDVKKRTKMGPTFESTEFISKFGLFLDLVLKKDPNLHHDVFKHILFGWNFTDSLDLEDFVHSKERQEISRVLLTIFLQNASYEEKMNTMDHLCKLENCFDIHNTCHFLNFSLQDQKLKNRFNSNSIPLNFVKQFYSQIDIKETEKSYFSKMTKMMSRSGHLEPVIVSLVAFKRQDVLEHLFATFPEKFKLFPSDLTIQYPTKFDKYMHKWCILLDLHDEDARFGLGYFKSLASTFPHVVKTYLKTLNGMLDHIDFYDRNELGDSSFRYFYVFDICRILLDKKIKLEDEIVEKMVKFVTRVAQESKYHKFVIEAIRSLKGVYLRQILHLRAIHKDFEREMESSVVLIPMEIAKMDIEVDDSSITNVATSISKNQQCFENLKILMNEDPETLIHLATRLAKLSSINSSPKILQISHQLLIKILEYDPNYYKMIIPQYCECLKRKDRVGTIALEFALEYYPYAMENANQILMIVWSKEISAQGTLEKLIRLKSKFE